MAAAHPPTLAFAGGKPAKRAGRVAACPLPVAPQWSSTLGGPGEAPGKFQTPAGMAVDSATGELFVVDLDNSRVQRLAPNGTVLAAWGSLGTSEAAAAGSSLSPAVQGALKRVRWAPARPGSQRCTWRR